ncbi:DUF4345 domain-containing protein [Parasphingorhabdus halotolerans]|uniref:DUF4345 domain-containing protein n=1 Tax=Parasphingorhabdus halotolerans TaxID=2725558 RepID=A0A6H2DJ32_9SPHN|nr:DUF4345 domain-containing protein [Parasphingorhabdus halotolerans]QJB67955.1 DUF4345 domain-containing protein [Parasphingorhabdus halotolerans]
MATTLKILIAIFGITCMIIALVHIAIGPSAIPGSVPVNATMDSEDRFYATLFLGFGAALLWCSQNLRARGGVFQALLLVFFLGGVARCVSAMQVGLPNEFFQLMWALELILPPLFWLWWRKYYRDPAIG